MDELLAEFRAAMPATVADGPDAATRLALEIAFLLGANMTLARLAKERDEGGEQAVQLAESVLGIESTLRIDSAKRDAFMAIMNHHHRKEP
jgi:hypothetical protein